MASKVITVGNKNPENFLLETDHKFAGLCCNHLHSSLLVHTKKVLFSVTSTADLHKPCPLSSLCTTKSKQVALWSPYTSSKGHITTLRSTGQNVGVTVQNLLEKSQKRDITAASPHSSTFFLLKHSLLSPCKPKRVTCSPQRNLTHIFLPVLDLPWTSGLPLSKNKIKHTKCPRNRECWFHGVIPKQSNSFSASLTI